jgi:AcrR family transcriptional regulator
VRRKPRDEARRARNDVYRQHILEAGERVFAERGFETAKVQEISALAGLSMGTIYGIFPSKNDLFRAILEERGEELLRLVRGVVTGVPEPRDALFALIELYIDYFLAHPSFLRMHLRSGASWALGPAAGTDERIRHWQEIHALQADVFRRGVEAGVFVDEDPAYLAKLLSVMDQVLLADWAATGMAAERDRLVERLRRQVERSVCRPGTGVGSARPRARGAATSPPGG